MLAAAYAAFQSDPLTARRQFKALAAAGDPRAQAAYALMLATGRAGGTDPTAAVHWYTKAAEQGHAEACYALGGIHLDGRGVAADAAVARQWYVRAADLGDREAMWALGATSVEPDEALTWWRRAAARGHVGASTWIGRALLGQGKVGDGAEALLEAATAGDEEALTELARALPAVRDAAGRGDPAAAWVAAAFDDDPAA
ncbi:MAG: tetratricopeptide repeat protein, partial [Myxococcota bacterium]